MIHKKIIYSPENGLVIVFTVLLSTITSLQSWMNLACNKMGKWEQITQWDIHHLHNLVTEHPQGSVHLALHTETSIMRPCHHYWRAQIYLMVEVQRLILQQRWQWDMGDDLNNAAVGAKAGLAADKCFLVSSTDVLRSENNGTNSRE